MGMDVWPADASHGVSLLFPTIDGRILRFETSNSGFITPFAGGLGPGLHKLKVGSLANAPYALSLIHISGTPWSRRSTRL